MERVILHCDCNSFFASVETVLDPSLRDVPMAVCGSVEDRHGIVLAKNEIAKQYGIVTAETVYSAKKKCPSLVIATPHREEYVRYSKLVNAIYLEYTDLVEPFGIDESWLDVTASRRIFGSGIEIAEQIRRRVREEIGITVSIGVSFNKVFAKLGSDYKKPDAITVFDKSNYKALVYPLPVGSLLFVGKRTEDQLHSFGIRTIGELAACSADLLEMRLGKIGRQLHQYAQGLDDSPVSPNEHQDAKSVGNGMTFKHDLVEFEECRTGIIYLAEEIGARLRKHGYKASGVSLSIKDSMLRVVQRQRPLRYPTDIGREIGDAAFKILTEEWHPGLPIRAITITALGIIRSDGFAEQIDMFGTDEDVNRDKTRKMEETVDIIKQKFGNGSIVSGASIGSDIGISNGED